jgi:hypothetical protein
MWAHRISGLTELFPQHCQLPNPTPHQHLQALTNELADSTAIASATTKGCRLLKLLQTNTNTILNPPPLTDTPRTVQRVTGKQQRVREEQQRVIDNTPILTILRITNNGKESKKNTPQVHQQITRNNNPGEVPMIARINPIPAIESVEPARCIRRVHEGVNGSQRTSRAKTKPTSPLTTSRRMPTMLREGIAT